MPQQQNGSPLDHVTIQLLGIRHEDDIAQIAAELQKLSRVAIYADSMATQLRMQIITQLRAEGFGGEGGLMSAILGSDEVRAANAAVAPLRAIQADAENIGRSAHRFVSRMQSRVFEPVRQARAARNGQTQGLVIN